METIAQKELKSQEELVKLEQEDIEVQVIQTSNLIDGKLHS